MLLVLTLALVLLGSLLAGPITVVANVRGKKYTIEAETVEEFTEKAESMAELEVGQQSVLFRGKVLSPTDRFEDIGIQENGKKEPHGHPPRHFHSQIPLLICNRRVECVKGTKATRSVTTRGSGEP